MNYIHQVTIAALICFNFQAMAQVPEVTGDSLSLESGRGKFNGLSDYEFRPLGLSVYLKYAHEGIPAIGSYRPEENSAAEWYMLFSSRYLKLVSNRPLNEFNTIYEYDVYHSSWIIDIAKSLILDRYGRQFQE